MYLGFHIIDIIGLIIEFRAGIGNSAKVMALCLWRQIRMELSEWKTIVLVDHGHG